MSDWKPIETAPKDGTTISVKNNLMDAPVDARFGDYTFMGRISQQWVLVRDYDKFMPVRPGALISPSHWKPKP